MWRVTFIRGYTPPTKQNVCRPDNQIGPSCFIGIDDETVSQKVGPENPGSIQTTLQTFSSLNSVPRRTVFLSIPIRPSQAYVAAGALETIVDAMDRFRKDWHLQTCGCEAISATVAALPRSNRQLLEGVFEAGAQRAVGRASLW